MLNPRKIATLGIGFGALAISVIGLLPDAEQPPIINPPFGGGGSGGGRGYSIERRDNIIDVKFHNAIEEQDEEMVVVLILVELIKDGYLC